MYLFKDRGTFTETYRFYTTKELVNEEYRSKNLILNKGIVSSM